MRAGKSNGKLRPSKALRSFSCPFSGRLNSGTRASPLAFSLSSKALGSPPPTSEYSTAAGRPPLLATTREQPSPATHFRDGSCYVHGSDSGRWAPHRPVYGHRRPRATNERGSRRRGGSGRSPTHPQTAPRPTCLVGLRRSLASVLPDNCAYATRGRRRRRQVGQRHCSSGGIAPLPPGKAGTTARRHVKAFLRRDTRHLMVPPAQDKMRPKPNKSAN